ncbi:unnamed protein product [Lymnaea stagnalis]|uniref:Uncharacterized protein n=1 Tax=Lymnaea stagnalis TaxID=6523 RepID=A0AAV2I9V2_LYMST
MYRKDGLCSSHLFKLWPIALNEAAMGPDLDIPKMFSSPLAHKKSYKTLKIRERRRKTIQSIDEIFQESSPGDLRSSKSDMSKSQPSILVPVDTSGAGFERMASFRQSLREEDDLGDKERRKRRRRTVSGVPENIMQELEQFERGRRIDRDRPRMYSLDDLDQKALDAKDEVMQQYLMEIDAAIAEREEEEFAEQREAKLLKFLPCRRSRSLPRCVKLISGSRKDGLTRSSLYQKKQDKSRNEEFSLKQSTDALHSKFTSTASLGSLRSSRSSKRSSMIGEKIKSLVTNTLKPRPKSLDFDSIEVKDEEDTKNKAGGRLKDRSSSLSRVISPSMPDGIVSRTTSTESQIGPGSYYYFNNNTIPRAQAKKYDFPWDSLPKDWTTSVKLREISKRRKEDRQSSSGNWSQSGYSSNRQSLDSDVKSSQPSTMSQYSLGKDSGRDSPKCSVERDGLDTGYMGDAASNESISDTKSMSNTDSDEWIRSLAERAASRGDVTSTSAEALANLSRLTKQNIRNLDILVPGRKCLRQPRRDFDDDGESSVYSLDTEGFYTSFHNDSGLRKSTNTLLDDEDMMMPSKSLFSNGLQSASSYSTVESAIFRAFDQEGSDTLTSGSSVSSPNLASLAGNGNDYPLSDLNDFDIPDIDAFEMGEGPLDTGTLKPMKDKPKRPPAPVPPPRTSSAMTSSGSRPNSDDLNSLTSNSVNSETSPESSDHEVIYARLKKKTSISVKGFPSWCPGLASDEDDITLKDPLSASRERLNAESSEVEEMFQLGKESWLSGTIPRSKMTKGVGSPETFSLTTNSWPRIKRPLSLQPGILKTPEKDKVKPTGNPKILNFDPVVNLFDAKSPHGVPLPLSRMSSSDESNSPPGSSPPPPSTTFDLSTQKSSSDCATEQGRPFKYIPTFNATRELKPSSHHNMPQLPRDVVGSSTPTDKQQMTSPTSAGFYDKDDANRSSYSSDLSAIHSSSCLSIASFDSFDAPLSRPFQALDRSSEMLGSNSTIALSDIDTSSFTHVTMTTNLSPSDSSFSLNWDTDDTPNPTPLVTPVRKKDLSSSNSSQVSRNRNLNDFSAQDTNSTVPNNPSINMPTLPKTSAVVSQALHEANSKLQTTGSNDRSSPFQSSINIKSMQSVTVTMPTNSAPAQTSSSDKNNNKSSYFNFPEPNMSQQSSSHQQSSRLNNSQTSNFRTNPPSHSNNQCQAANSSMAPRMSQKERRRSSPITNEQRNDSSSSAVSGNESGSSSSCKGSIKDSSNRRRSGTDAYSPADSGFGSPSVFSEPGSVVYSPSEQPAQNISKGPQIKQMLLTDTKSHIIQKPALAAVGGSQRSEYPMKALSTIPSQSNDSLNSQYSFSSTSQLIGKNAKTDLSQPVLHSGTSSESLHSNSSAGRSASYRVALLTESQQMSLIPDKQSHCINNNNITKTNPPLSRTAQTRSMSIPAPECIDDNINRADSYRCAVRNTQSAYIADMMGRNSSYRLATCDEDVVVTNSRMEACNLWTGKTGATRDVRRMGITDVDQLKHYLNEPDGRGRHTGKQSVGKNVDTLHSKKRLSVKSDTLVDPNPKTSPSEQRHAVKSSSKDKNKQKTQSSTYIRFDPIFESGEDLRASSESLRPPSIVSIKTLAKADSNDIIMQDNSRLIGQKNSVTAQTRRRSGSQGRKSSEEKSGLTLFDSIRTTFKSIGGGKDSSYK